MIGGVLALGLVAACLVAYVYVWLQAWKEGPENPKTFGREAEYSPDVFYVPTWEPAPPIAKPSIEEVFRSHTLLSTKAVVQESGKERLRIRYKMALSSSHPVAQGAPVDSRERKLWLFCQSTDQKPPVQTIYDVSRCNLRVTSIYKHTLEVVSPYSALAAGHFSLFILFEDEASYQEWYCFLTLTNLLPLFSPPIYESIWQRMNSLSKKGASSNTAADLLSTQPISPKMSCDWLNCLLARWVTSMREGTRLELAIRQALAMKIAAKLFEKGLDAAFSDIRLLDVQLGTAAPKFHSISIHPPDVPGAMVIDISVSYVGDFYFSFAAKLSLPGIKTEIQAAVLLHELSGRLLLHAEPTGQLISFSFFHFPDLAVDITYRLGKVQPSLFDLKKFILKKLKVSLGERLVIPNRKYIRIPRTPKTYYEQKEVKMKDAQKLAIDWEIHNNNNANSRLSQSGSNPVIMERVVGNLSDLGRSPSPKVKSPNPSSSTPQSSSSGPEIGNGPAPPEPPLTLKAKASRRLSSLRNRLQSAPKPDHE
ncbi:MAG: hypothetical protein Q8P67_12990 [archaeon]|nr:hypothetical protein [archaeon]